MIRLNLSSRALFYKNIASFQLQSYLLSCNISTFRQSISRLRVSAHRLMIECGRWAKPNPFDRRICNICQTLKDEFHFVLICSLYNEIRRKYIPMYFRCRPSMDKFVELITTEHELLLRQLSVYIHKAFLITTENT